MRCICLSFAAALALPSIARSQQAPTQVTVPLIFEYNRPYVDLSFKRPDGTIRKARFILDTGGGAFSISDSLAKDIGVEIERTVATGDGQIGLVTKFPVATIEGFPLELPVGRTGVTIGKNNIMPSPQHAEGMVPGLVLSKYHVVFDYPRKRFTIAMPGVLTPKGTAMPMPVGRTGFPRTEVTVGDSTYGLLLDTGGAFTMVSEVLLKSFGAAHPAWKRFPGANGEAAWLGGMTLETMYLPSLTWAGITVNDAGVTSQREGTFERSMSNLMAAPIVGSLAGNVLRGFRVELDYPNQKLYISR